MSSNFDINQFSAVAPEEQEEMLGEVLSANNVAQQPELVAFISRTLRELDIDELHKLLVDDDAIRVKIAEAVNTFQEQGDGSAESLPVYEWNEDFECGVCSDDIGKDTPHIHLANDPVCKECYLSDIRPKFIAAMEREDDYPVAWGSEDLQPYDLPDFDAGFLAKWSSREKIYKTPKAQRLYCKHLYYTHDGKKFSCAQPEYVEKRRNGIDTGDCLSLLGVVAETKGSQIRCSDCQGTTCGTCGQPTKPLQGEVPGHRCDPSILGQEPDIDKTLIRGVDYQLCPNPTCGRIRNLLDGCNHMICICRTHYCYICGAKAHANSNHWLEGMPCPRYNQPRTQRAQFDEEEVLPPQAPLVIEPRYVNQARNLRAEANQPSLTERGRQMKLDQALCWEYLGDARARRARSAEQERTGNVWWNVDFAAPLEQLLTVMRNQMDMYIFFEPRGDRNEKVKAGRRIVPPDEATRAFNSFRLTRMDIEGPIAAFRREHGEWFAAPPYRELGPLIDRYTEIMAQHMEELTTAAIAVQEETPGRAAKKARR